MQLRYSSLRRWRENDRLLFGRNDDVILGNRVRRRALGATKGHIRVQFLAEAILLALLGGATGALATAIYASTTGWAVVTAGCEAPGSGPAAGHKAHVQFRAIPARPGLCTQWASGKLPRIGVQLAAGCCTSERGRVGFPGA